MIDVTCKCGTAFQVPDSFAGREHPCPGCNKQVGVPLDIGLKAAPLPDGLDMPGSWTGGLLTFLGICCMIASPLAFLAGDFHRQQASYGQAGHVVDTPYPLLLLGTGGLFLGLSSIIRRLNILLARHHR